MGELKKQVEGVRPPEEITELTIGKDSTDRYGHVNYKAWPGLLENSQDEYMEKRGLGFDVIESRYGMRSFVRRTETEYTGQVFDGDTVQVYTSISRMGNSNITYEQRVEREGQQVVKYGMVVVMVDDAGKPQTIPEEIRQKLPAPAQL